MLNLWDIFDEEQNVSVQFSRSFMSDSLWPHGLQHTRLPCCLLSPRVCSNSCPLSWWCHPTTSSSDAHFSSCPQSFPASGSFQWVGSLHLVAKELELQHQSFRWIFWQGWFPLGLTSLISLLSRGLSRVFSSTTFQKHQFFKAQPSLCNSHIHTCLL